GSVRRSIWHWYDNADRRIATADHGSGDTSTNHWIATSLPGGYDPDDPLDWTDAAVYNGNVLLMTYGYDPATGRPDTTTHGVRKNGSNTVTTTTKTFYDDLGRRVAVAENWVDYV